MRSAIWRPISMNPAEKPGTDGAAVPVRATGRRTAVFAVFAGFLALFALAAGPGHDALAKEPRNPHLDKTALDDLARVSAYLNSLTTLSGKFIQISERGGKSDGVFYMKRPGKLRFEYNPPVPIVFVVDGVFVNVEDKKLETVNAYPLKETPLKLLLVGDVDLAQDADIVSVERSPGQLQVTAKDDEGLAQGQLTMIFSDPGLELRQWVVIDSEDTRTMVVLRDVRHGGKMKASLFVPTDYEFESND